MSSLWAATGNYQKSLSNSGFHLCLFSSKGKLAYLNIITVTVEISHDPYDEFTRSISEEFTAELD